MITLDGIEVKVGMKLWDAVMGWGEVTCVADRVATQDLTALAGGISTMHNGPMKTIRVSLFERQGARLTGYKRAYYCDASDGCAGKENVDHNRVLFLDEIKITPPKPPVSDFEQEVEALIFSRAVDSYERLEEIKRFWNAAIDSGRRAE